MKKTLALPYLPAEEIGPAFEHLKGKASTPALRDVVNFVSQTH
jgi:hypothetical protein